MSYTVVLDSLLTTPKVVVVGCGGTGSIVSEGLCRLLANSELELLLIDMDRVEPSNLIRQSFYPGDVGKFKSQVLAERLARQYCRPVGYSVYPFERGLIDEEFGGLGVRQVSCIIIGCVDRASARRSIAEGLKERRDFWLDAGNGYQSGQVLIGNVASVERLAESFGKESQTANYLPIPSLQLPELLHEPSVVKPPQDCAEAVAQEEQSPMINQTMATLVLQFFYRLLNEKLTWMGAYIDMETGTLRTVPASPEIVARMFGLKPTILMQDKAYCSRASYGHHGGAGLLWRSSDRSMRKISRL